MINVVIDDKWIDKKLTVILTAILSISDDVLESCFVFALSCFVFSVVDTLIDMFSGKKNEAISD